MNLAATSVGSDKSPSGRADERRSPGPVVRVAPQEPLPGQGHWEAREGVDAFACNQVRLRLEGFGYQIMNVQRALLERMTETGWRLRRLAERVLLTPARFTVSGRWIAMITGGALAALAHASPRGLQPFTAPPDSAGAARGRRQSFPALAAARTPRCLQAPAKGPAKPNNYSLLDLKRLFLPPELPRPALARVDGTMGLCHHVHGHRLRPTTIWM